MRMSPRITLLPLIAVFTAATLAGCRLPRPEPDIKNESYGEHERNVLDFWRAPGKAPTPVMLYLHGGGFISGSKDDLGGALIYACLDAGISVAACNYRYSTDAIYPAPMADCARAVQYLRYHAERFNIDPAGIAVVGDSAGGTTALWVAYQDDLAEPASADPVSRESTGVAVAGVFDAPCSLDPRYIRALIGGRAYEHPALALLFGVYGAPCRLDEAYLSAYYIDASPINHLDAGDPPTYMYYSEPDAPLTGDLNTAPCETWPTCSICYPYYGQEVAGYPLPGEGIHHPWFGIAVAQELAAEEIDFLYRHIDDYGTADPAAQVITELVDFITFHTGG